MRNDRLRVTVVSFISGLFWFLALAQVFYSRATPIIDGYNASVNGNFYIFKNCG